MMGMSESSAGGSHLDQHVVVTNSNEYLSALKTADPLLHNIKCKPDASTVIELCGEIDLNIEESTSLLYEEDYYQALAHMQVALKRLNV